MDEAKIYIKGKAGFKPAVKQRIAHTWKHHGSEVDVNTIMFLVPAEFQLKTFKTSIGEEVIKAFELQFLTGLHEEDTVPAGVRRFFPMPAWSIENSNLKSGTNQRPQHDPSKLVF